MLLGALRDATRIARMSHRAVVGFSPPFTLPFTAVVLLDHGPFFVARGGSIGSASLRERSQYTHARLHVMGIETLADTSCPRLCT